MKNTRKRLFLLSLIVLTDTLLFNACSEDTTDNQEPGMSEGTASATVEFLDTKGKVQFTGTAKGATGTGDKDTVLMTFAGTDKPMQFILMITPVAKGTHMMRKDGFKTFGVFHQDTTQSKNYLNAYLVGEDNIDDNGLEMDGEASFTISSFSNKNIKGTFEFDMIKNTTIKEDGEVISGEIKTIKVTGGKFDVPLN